MTLPLVLTMADSVVLLDDESIPLWVRIEECMRLLDVALKEAKKRGAHMVDMECQYYTAKANECFALLEAGHANTFIQQVIKGRPSVAEAMKNYHAADVEYKNANEAINAMKSKLRVLENEQEREWEQARRV